MPYFTFFTQWIRFIAEYFKAGVFDGKFIGYQVAVEDLLYIHLFEQQVVHIKIKPVGLPFGGPHMRCFAQ
jgi:hypothetical protein